LIAAKRRTRFGVPALTIIATRVGVLQDVVKEFALTVDALGGNTDRVPMRDDFNTHSSAGLSQAAHGVVAILLVSILPR
jgi:hypothetical protein